MVFIGSKGTQQTKVNKVAMILTGYTFFRNEYNTLSNYFRVS